MGLTHMQNILKAKFRLENKRKQMRLSSTTTKAKNYTQAPPTISHHLGFINGQSTLK